MSARPWRRSVQLIETDDLTVEALIEATKADPAGYFDDGDGFIGLRLDASGHVHWYALRAVNGQMGWISTGSSLGDLNAPYKWLVPPTDPLLPAPPV